MKRITRMSIAVAMAAALLAGCGSSATVETVLTQKESAQAAASAAADTTAEAAEAASAAEGDFDTSSDITVISREDGSGTRGAFIELTGVEQKDADGKKVDMTSDEAQIVNSTSIVLTTVANDPYAIGYISLGSLNDTVKALKIDGAEATAENIKAGSYKVARPFNIATMGEPTDPLVKDFISFIMSAEGQQVVADNGYIPLDGAQPFAGTNPEGEITVGGSSSVSPVMEKLIEAYAAVNTKAKVALQTSDSTTGMTSAIEGSYDIGMASRELKQEELDKGLVNQVIATDGIAIIVNKSNTISDLTTEQVKNIYVGDAVTWDEVQ